MSEPTYTGCNTEFYVADAQTARVVNLAVSLRRPLLVEGEPGCGKTMLAYSVAAEKQLGAPVKFSVKSTSKALDLLYRLNSFKRLQEAQSPHNTDARFVYPYLSLGPLGKVIHERKRAVVLIDEIDKADIDFPNDLLDVLDNFSFQIDELPLEEVQASLERNGFGQQITLGDTQHGELIHPIVIITSNREKRLPEPFLRRCLYVRLQFPSTTTELSEIVRKNTKLSVEELNQKLLDTAIEAFVQVRRAAKASDLQKLPSTSELIDWIRILAWSGETAESIGKNLLLPPSWELLFKTASDLEGYPAAAEAAKL